MTTYPEVSFRTFFGDYLNGLWVTWKSTPSSNTGTSDLEITFQCNLRSRLHIFGFGTTYDATTIGAAGLYDPGWTSEGYSSPYYDLLTNFGENNIGTDYKDSTSAGT